MTHFENIACKVMGVILFLLVVILGLQLTSCASKVPNNQVAPEVQIKPKKQAISLLDSSGNSHKYKVDVSKLNLPNDNQLLTQYCMNHYQWENITVFRHLKNGTIETWYRISPHRKQ